jgi:hypothetical protein
MKSSDDKIDRAKVEQLVKAFLDVVEGTLNTVDQIAKVNTVEYDGKKFIKAGNFRMNIRNLKVQLLADLATSMNPDNMPEPPKAS